MSIHQYSASSRLKKRQGLGGFFARIFSKRKNDRAVIEIRTIDGSAGVGIAGSEYRVTTVLLDLLLPFILTGEKITQERIAMYNTFMIPCGN